MVFDSLENEPVNILGRSIFESLRLTLLLCWFFLEFVFILLFSEAGFFSASSLIIDISGIELVISGAAADLCCEPSFLNICFRSSDTSFNRPTCLIKMSIWLSFFSFINSVGPL